MEPTDIREDVAIFVNFNQGPRQVRDFRLHVTWIFKEMTEVEEKLSLHPTNKIGQVVLRRTETAQPAEGVPDASVRLRRTRCSVRDRPFNPRRLTFVNYFEAAGPAWPRASTLPAPRVAGVLPGQLRFAFVRRRARLAPGPRPQRAAPSRRGRGRAEGMAACPGGVYAPFGGHLSALRGHGILK